MRTITNESTSKKANRRPPTSTRVPRKVVAAPAVVLNTRKFTDDQVQDLRVALKTANTRLNENKVEIKRSYERGNEAKREFMGMVKLLNRAVIGLTKIQDAATATGKKQMSQARLVRFMTQNVSRTLKQIQARAK